MILPLYSFLLSVCFPQPPNCVLEMAHSVLMRALSGSTNSTEVSERVGLQRGLERFERAGISHNRI